MKNLTLQEYFEKLLNEPSSLQNRYSEEHGGFPKYRITQTSEHNYTLELALAGYDKRDIKVSTAKNSLMVSCIVDTSRFPKEDEKSEFPIVIENHIANRNFTKTWVTNEQYNMHVENASMENGILKIEIEVEVPEKVKETVYKIR